MPTDQEYERMIAKYTRRNLATLWQQILARNTPGWDPGKAFEYYILRAFQLEGVEVQWPYRVQDRHIESLEIEQIDGVLFLGGRSYLVSSKDETGPVDINPIARLRDQLSRRPACVMGLLFSRSGFTPPVLRNTSLASAPTVLLWEGVEIDEAVRGRRLAKGLEAKYRKAVTHGIIDFDIRTPVK
jgi:hypothetical protein